MENVVITLVVMFIFTIVVGGLSFLLEKYDDKTGKISDFFEKIFSHE